MGMMDRTSCLGDEGDDLGFALLEALLVRGRIAGKWVFAGQLVVGHPLGQASTIKEAHREIVMAGVLADFVDRDDIGVVEVGGRLGLMEKPLDLPFGGHLPRQDEFEGHWPVQADLARAPHNAHAAPSDFLDQLVVTKGSDERGVRSEA